MLTNLKALVVVLALALATFALARPICLQFMTEQTFKRRRAIWFALTVVGFASPTFWTYAIFALVALGVAAWRDENPLALYVMVTFTIPNVSLTIPAPFINQFFSLTQLRILSLAIVIPAIWQMGHSAAGPRLRALRAEDMLLAAFLILQVVLLMPYEALTNTGRRSFLFLIDTFIVFYAFGRLPDRQRAADVMASFWMGCLIMAPIGIFESLKGWLLYTGLAAEWGDPNVFSWLFRGDSLRAQAAANHSINLGYQLALALGLYLYLRAFGVGRKRDGLILALLAAGIVVSYSRAAWVTALVIAIAFAALRRDASRRLIALIAMTAAAYLVLYVTPLKESILDQLPFIGTAAQDTIDYRQQLAETSWPLILQNPFFGDPFVFLRMEALRQGQGIIDIVNGYIFTALFTGFVGLGLQMSVFGVALIRSFGVLFAVRQVDDDLGLMGASLLACILGSLVYIAAAGFEGNQYVLCGVLISYAVFCRSEGPVLRASATPQHASVRPRFR